MFGWLKRREEPAVPTPTTPPTRLYMINGEPHRPYKEPAYSTDPETYGMQRKSGISDEEYAEACKRMKVFVKRDDAIDFAYHCNLASLTCPVFDRVGAAWKFNEDETSRMADDIN